MELTRKNWSKNDINTFNLYLESLKNENKIESYELIYYGICKECLNKEGKNYEKI